MSSADILRQLAQPAVAAAVNDGANALDQNVRDAATIAGLQTSLDAAAAQHAADQATIAELEAELHPAPPPGKTAWGINIPRRQLPAMDTLLGGIDAVRFYHSAAGPRPIVRWPTKAELGGDLGNRVLVYSAKPPPQDVAAGKYDGDYEAWCAAAPKDRFSYLCARHEQENDTGYSLADSRAMWARMTSIVRASGNPRILVTPILMQYTLDPHSGRRYKDWLPAVYDVLGFDFYPTSVAAIDVMIGRMRATAKAEGKPWIVGEVGKYGHPEVLGPLAKALAAEKLPVVTYYNNGNNSLTAAEAAAWKSGQTG